MKKREGRVGEGRKTGSKTKEARGSGVNISLSCKRESTVGRVCCVLKVHPGNCLDYGSTLKEDPRPHPNSTANPWFPMHGAGPQTIPELQSKVPGTCSGKVPETHRKLAPSAGGELSFLGDSSPLRLFSFWSGRLPLFPTKHPIPPPPPSCSTCTTAATRPALH